MKTPKRKAPERKPARKEPGPVFRAGAAMLRLAAARPALTGGICVFTIVFGMISANALWYQPGGHPSPLLRTRDAADRKLLFGFQRPDEPQDVTTFRIERTDAGESGSPTGTVRPAASDLVRGVQAELARLGLYDGAADGLAGPRTAAAILAFQKSAELAQTGEASGALLDALKAAGHAPASAAAPVSTPGQAVAPVAVPASRPTAVPARDEVDDPVAEAIRNAGQVAPPATIPATPAAMRPADSSLTAQIQRGLSKFAYSHITVDGVAGTETREAIRNFEKAYRLPETGEPNERVLKKLKEIGAL
ncbi:peptidoglycan-binding protein [Rhizobiaceae bacterium BDR2-2]|uniref:Peptidoglycan-binding protein n=1 Tax=Ectorhizobium quercum TaxID=2965071 RepID=A0AAE3N1J2_9HYPH|nr:peptidoglycan-binding protein [Ectorhizobium quercum]MCX8998486.1 peptidoglycan-binding protein [Ectorhizobium quercum]